MSLVIRQPVRRAFHMGKGNSIYLTLPPELGIKHGDEVIFKIEDGKIILEKV